MSFYLMIYMMSLTQYCAIPVENPVAIPCVPLIKIKGSKGTKCFGQECLVFSNYFSSSTSKTHKYSFSMINYVISF